MKSKSNWKGRLRRSVQIAASKAAVATSTTASTTAGVANKAVQENQKTSEEQATDAALEIIHGGRKNLSADAKERSKRKKKNKPGNSKQSGKKKPSAFKQYWKNKQKKAMMRGAALGGTSPSASSAAASSSSKQLAHKIKEIIARAVSGTGVKIALVAMALVVLIASSIATVALPLTTAISQSSVVTSYATDDSVIIAVDDIYTSYEAQVESVATGVADSNPGYDKYRYIIAEIGHNPYQLAALLTAHYGEYSQDQVTALLKEILNKQYTATATESTETRTSKTTNEAGEEVEEEYEVRILTVTLTNNGIDAAAKALLTEDEYAHYQVLVATNGNRDDLFQGTWTGNVSSSTGSYQVPSEALSDEKFAAMLAEAEKYLGWPYIWGGSSPSTSFDCSGYVSWVINASGVGSVGRSTAEGLRQQCAYVSAADAKPGDLIFFQNTYPTEGASHVGIYVGNGMMIHCGSPIQYTSIESAYWQSHFLSFGRI